MFKTSLNFLKELQLSEIDVFVFLSGHHPKIFFCHFQFTELGMDLSHCWPRKKTTAALQNGLDLGQGVQAPAQNAEVKLQ